MVMGEGLHRGSENVQGVSPYQAFRATQKVHIGQDGGSSSLVVRQGQTVLYNGTTVQTLDGQSVFASPSVATAIRAGLFVRDPSNDPEQKPFRRYGRVSFSQGVCRTPESHLLTEHYRSVMWRASVWGREGTLQLVRERLSFSSTESMVKWVRAHAGSETHLEAYDIISLDAPRPKRLHAVNSVFSRLRSSYWGAKEKAVSSCRSWPHRDRFLDLLWRQVWGTPIRGGRWYENWTEEHRRCFWYPSNRKRFYAMPSTRSLVIDISWGVGDRCMIHDTSETPKTASQGVWRFDPAYGAGFGSVSSEGLPEAFCGHSGEGRLCKEALANGSSVVVGFPITDGQGGRAVYLKPVGVDQVYLEKFDRERFVLEAVTNSGDEVRIQRLDPDEGERSTGPILSNALSGMCYGGRVDFSFRDLETGLVSQVGDSWLELVQGQRFRPLCLEVKRGSP